MNLFASGEGMSSFAPQTNAKGTLVRGANDDFHKFTASDQTTTLQAAFSSAISNFIVGCTDAYQIIRAVPCYLQRRRCHLSVGGMWWWKHGADKVRKWVSSRDT